MPKTTLETKSGICLFLFLPLLYFTANSVAMRCGKTKREMCGEQGVIKMFPHCIGYWPPNYGPENINTTKDDASLYVHRMSEDVSELDRSSYIEQHTIQVSILLPATFTDELEDEFENVTLAPAQKRSGIGTLVGFQTIRDKKLIRDDILFNITLRDSKCDETYGNKGFNDAYSDGVHVLFGPSCDYSLGNSYSRCINTLLYL